MERNNVPERKQKEGGGPTHQCLLILTLQQVRNPLVIAQT